LIQAAVKDFLLVEKGNILVRKEERNSFQKRNIGAMKNEIIW